MQRFRRLTTASPAPPKFLLRRLVLLVKRKCVNRHQNQTQQKAKLPTFCPAAVNIGLFRFFYVVFAIKVEKSEREVGDKI